LRAIDQVRLLGDCVIAELSWPAQECTGDRLACDRFAVRPAALDACFQVAASMAPEGALWIPSSIGRVGCFAAAGAPCQVIARRRASETDGAMVIDVELRGSQGALLELSEVRLEQMGGEASGDVRQRLFRQTWKPQERVPASPRQCRWVLVAEDEHFGHEVAAQLQLAGRPVAVVPAGELLSEAGERLLDAAMDGDRLQPVEVLYLPRLAEGWLDPSAIASTSLERAVRLVQWLDRFEAAPRRCWFVTRGACAVGEDDGQWLSLAQAALWGLGAAAAVEHPSLWGGCIDLDPQMPAAESAASLVDEIGAGGAAAVAIRAGQRLVPCLAEAGIEDGGSSAVRFRADATYLVTGGLGGIGLKVAQWMVARGARRLAILGRTQLPSRSLWAAMDSSSPRCALVRGVQMLESLGASVHYATVDLTDAGRLEAFLDSFHAEGWPAIKGVFHAAGSIDDRLIADLDASSLRGVMAGKAFGAWHLHRLLPQVDFFVLFSSVASLLPQPGQASYAAANSFLDALAHLRRAGGQVAHSINWAVWEGVGFAATAGGAEARRRFQELGIEPLAPARGIGALETVLSRADAQVAVLPLDRSRLRDGLASCDSRSRALLAPLAAVRPAQAADGEFDVGAVESFVALLLRQDPARRGRLLQERLAGHAATVLRLGAARLDPRSPLGSYGLNSLMAMELRNRIENDLGLPLSATALWNYPSLVALAEHLLSRLVPEAAPPASPQSDRDDADADAQPEPGSDLLDVQSLSDDEALAALLEGAGPVRRRA
jgi:myxalamid-type polyketide synthase MxaE and MxaD